MLLQTNDRVKELDTEWIELIQMAINVEIPLEEIRGFLLAGRQ